MLNSLKINEEAFQKVEAYLKKQYRKEEEKRTNELKRTQLDYNKTKSKLSKYVLDNLSKISTVTEQQIYETERKRLEQVLSLMDSEITQLKQRSGNGLLDFQSFLSVMRHAGSNFEKLPNVQKRKLVNLLILNIIVRDD